MSVAVVGGGLIGVEAAEVLHLRGLKVHFLIREPWYFPVALDDREAEVVAAHIRHHGVDCRTGTPVSGFERRGNKLVLALPGEELPVDLVVGAIGVVPNTDFLAGSGITLHPGTGGVEVGDTLESVSAPGVFAAGDCANVTWLDGSRRPEQLWYTARDQGRVAALAMLGDDVRYRRGTWYNSAKFFDIEYTTAGYVPVSTPEKTGVGSGWQTWYQQLPGRAVTQRIVLKDGLVKGFNGLGTRWDHQVWMRWIQERRTLAWVLPRLAEAQFDEEFMPLISALPTATLSEGA
jgi:NADPH-dependent 2,4-dienoyl-CoA reductase/sulfur reductase-like enzyme